MTDRDTILRRVRAALQSPPAVPADAPIERTLPEGADVLALMVDRLEDYRATVIDARGAVSAAIAAALRDRGIDTAVIDPQLDPRFRPEGVLCVEDVALDAHALDALPAAITTCAVAVAETGTILLTHGPGQGRRAISLIPDVHVCVLDRHAIVGTLPEAIERIGRPRIATWISGPSATSDIELDRVEGVHGPRTLIVVLA